MKGNKKGLVTKNEVKVLWKVVSGFIPIPKALKPIANLFIPSLLDGIDNKYGDKIPEPWQSHLENLTTLVVKALEDDGKISEIEAVEISEYAAEVINENVDLKIFDKDTQLLLFVETLRMLAVFLYGVLNKNKEELEE